MSSSAKPVLYRPSSSVLVVSPTNQILLLRRTNASSYASAHVFPGGAVDPQQDGAVTDDPCKIHFDSPAYRLAAIRECFEESGLLLAKNEADGTLVWLPEARLQEARRRIHSQKISFQRWLKRIGAVADTEGLLPFTRWVSPHMVAKRFTTQMYIYFMPVETAPAASTPFVPTTDGGLEHTEAAFDDAQHWVQQAQRNEITLFPPQIYLLALVSQFLTGTPAPGSGDALSIIEAQRNALREFIKTPQTGEDACAKTLWADKVMSPVYMGKIADGRAVYRLDSPGQDLRGQNRYGDKERVVVGILGKEGAKSLEVRKRSEVKIVPREKL
ncbi:hypothetical protein TD95_001272 [Thielaviopsis punctulata]|uniref:Nudix hydrolase domain-containing protein n=1 Tax=Thielaviopsis punctulata TaxID=72032 RepID=A0A0F4ZC93_9PEZI|nr:hypothetical protein TD95_001272 [Thielaviopsis punctulata]